MLTDSIIIALVPACVEVAKRSGLPSRFGAGAAILFAIVLVALSHLAVTSAPLNAMQSARLLLTGLIDGLAAVGLYRIVPKPTRIQADSPLIG